VRTRFIERGKAAIQFFGDGGGGHIDPGTAQTAIATVPLLIFEYRSQQMGAAEVRPQGLRDVQFRVSDLPQQKLLMRISPEVRMSRSGSGDKAVYRCAAMVSSSKCSESTRPSTLASSQGRVHRVHDLGAAAVVDGQVHQQAAV